MIMKNVIELDPEIAFSNIHESARGFGFFDEEKSKFHQKMYAKTTAVILYQKLTTFKQSKESYAYDDCTFDPFMRTSQKLKMILIFNNKP